MHAATLTWSPRSSEHGRTLWRLEVQPHVANLLVLTPQMPSWESVIEQAGWPSSADGQPRVADLAPLLDQLVVGREFSFRVRANPTSAVRAGRVDSESAASESGDEGDHVAGSRERGRRLGHRTAATQLAWFVERATGEAVGWGFTVGDAASPAVRIEQREHLRFAKRRGGPQVSLDVATFEGRLTVTDADALRHSVLSGLGRGKAYGCGLLTLAPGGGHVVAG